MPAPVTIREFIELGCKAELLDRNQATAFCQKLRQDKTPCTTPRQLADALVKGGLLTAFQANQLLLGRWHGFTLSKKYRLLDCIGSGGMGSVYLCEHIRMHRLVAVKVLPAALAKDPTNLERFEREARAVAALNHPNIVRAHDIDEDKSLHYLVMEYVEGDSLQNVVKKNGPLDPVRAAHYVSQAASGLQHAHEAGLVHRDVKPANLLLDRHGVIKILDLGLARFFHDSDDELTKKHDTGAILGTADYLAPEQVEDSSVDIRADIYSLGATFYFLLAGHAPFHDRTVPQKLLAHQMRYPRSVRSLRPEVPAPLEAVLLQMMAKKPAERFAQPRDVVRALAPWTQAPIALPSEKELRAAFARRESAALTGSETAIDRAAPARPAKSDIADIPTAITKPGQTPTPTRGSAPAQPAPAEDALSAPKSSRSSEDSGSLAGAPTSPDLLLEDTDPFALAKAGSSLISEDSVFCAQFTRTGSSRRTEAPTPHRTWLLLAALGLLATVVALGGWLVYLGWSSPTDGGGAETPPPSAPPGPATPPSTKPEYVAAASPYGKLLRVISGSGAAVTGVALSPDGKTLVVATKDRTPKMWDAITGQSLGNLVGHAQAVNAVAFSADGESVLTGGQDRSLYLWGVRFIGNQKVQMSDPDKTSQAIYCVAFVPPGRQAVSGGADNKLRLWDLSGGNIVRAFQGHSQPVWSAAVAPDGRRMLSGSADGTARLWDLNTGQTLREWKGHQGAVKAVAFSPDGRLAATGGQDKLIFVWDADQNKKVQTLSGHDGAVTALVFSPDGRYLISTGAKGTAHVWELTTGQELFAFGPFGQPITCLSLSADGATLALGGPSQEVRLYRTPSFLHAFPAGPRHLLSEHKAPVEAVAVSPDGKLLASAGQDRAIRLWELADPKLVRTFSDHQDTVVSLEFSSDGKRLLSASRDKTVRVWDVNTGGQVQVYSGDLPFQQAVFAPGGQGVLAAAEDPTLRLWEVVEGKPKVVKEFTADTGSYLAPRIWGSSLLGTMGTPLTEAPLMATSALLAGRAPVWGVAWSPDGKRIVGAGADQTLVIWDSAGKLVQALATPSPVRRMLFTPNSDHLLTDSGQPMAYLWKLQGGTPTPQVMAGHTDVVSAVTVSRDGRLALTGARNGEMILWDLEYLRPLHFYFGHKGAVKDLALTPDLRQAVSASDDGTVRLWHLPSCVAEPVPGRFTEFGPHPQEVERLAVAPDGKTVATAGRDGVIRLWELATGKELGKLTGHGNAVSDVVFSPDGKWLASAGTDGGVRLWRVDGGKEFYHFRGHDGPVPAVAYAPDGKWLLSGGADHLAILWGLSLTGNKAQEFRGHKGPVSGVAFVPGGGVVLTASHDGTLGLWNVVDAKKVQDLTGHTGPVLALAVSPDGKLAASGGADNSVRLWDLSDGKLLHTFTGHTKAVTCVAFSPDGQRVLSGGADQTLRLWDVPRRQLLQTMTGSLGPITGVAFSPDGRRGVSCGEDRVLRLWDLPMLHPARFAWK